MREPNGIPFGSSKSKGNFQYNRIPFYLKKTKQNLRAYRHRKHLQLGVTNSLAQSFLRSISACGGTHREIFSESYSLKPKSDCIYHFLIDLEPNVRPFGFKSIGKW